MFIKKSSSSRHGVGAHKITDVFDFLCPLTLFAHDNNTLVFVLYFTLNGTIILLFNIPMALVDIFDSCTIFQTPYTSSRLVFGFKKRMSLHHDSRSVSYTWKSISYALRLKLWNIILASWLLNAHRWRLVGALRVGMYILITTNLNQCIWHLKKYNLKFTKICTFILQIQ